MKMYWLEWFDRKKWSLSLNSVRKMDSVLRWGNQFLPRPPPPPPHQLGWAIDYTPPHPPTMGQHSALNTHSLDEMEI